MPATRTDGPKDRNGRVAHRTSRARSNAAPPSARQGWSPRPLASLVAAADLLTAELLAGQLTSTQLKAIVRQVAYRIALPTPTVLPAVHALVARDSRFLACEPDAAVEAQLAALVLFGPVRHASLWLSDNGEETCVGSHGGPPPRRRLRGIARRTIAGDRPRSSAAENWMLHAFPVSSADVHGSLVVEAKPRNAARAIQFAEEASRVFVPVLGRLLPRDNASIASAELLHAADRRVARIGFDLHDGPLQELSLLAGELATFGRQLETLIADDASRAIARGRIADLNEMTAAIGADLRDIAATGGRATLSLREGLDQIVGRFQRRNGVDLHLRVDGEIDRTTPSQRIAAARVVEEALANVREHSRARNVEVAVVRDDDQIHVCVRDDGVGFDVTRARRRASRERRLGLTVMGERVRLLGGSLRIDSRRGGPTLISASLPAWDSDFAAARASSGGVVG